jgi:hypothetical protein
LRRFDDLDLRARLQRLAAGFVAAPATPGTLATETTVPPSSFPVTET